MEIQASVWTDLDSSASGMEYGFDAQAWFARAPMKTLRRIVSYVRRDLKTATGQGGGWVTGIEEIDDIFPRVAEITGKKELIEVLKFCEDNDLGWNCSINGHDVLTWWNIKVGKELAHSAVDKLLGQ